MWSLCDSPEAVTGRQITVPVALGVYAYAGLLVALPFIADAGPSLAGFVAIWVGGSAIAGAVIHHWVVFAVPVGTLAVLLLLAFTGYSDTEFLSDALSSIALYALMVGEFVGLGIGYALVSLVRARRHSV